jgi:UDP:flavonoid glycosyltransferase YjiC (YdhE family)
MRTDRKKILFFAEGITMTHFARPAALAQALDPALWDVYFWTPRRYHPLLRRSFTQLGELETMEPAVFLDRLARGDPAYPADVLHRYVLDELRILDEIRPDLVIGDFRLSLCVSAPLRKTPFAFIFNAQWSPYRRQPAIVPDVPITKWISPTVLNPVYAILRPAFFFLHAKPLNDVRRTFGLPRISHDVRGVFTAGDLVFYPDIPEFVPLDSPPAHHHFVGACPWELDSPKPAWWEEVMAFPEPKVLVSLGSSGPIRALPAVLEALSTLPFKVIVTTSGRSVDALGSNVYATDLLPYEETSRRCAVVVSHGGTGSLYPALSAGTPVLAIPGNIDNHLSADLLQRSGAGLQVRVEYATPQRVRSAFSRLIAEHSFKASASKWAATLAGYDTKTIFPRILNEWFAARNGSADPGTLRFSDSS